MLIKETSLQLYNNKMKLEDMVRRDRIKSVYKSLEKIVNKTYINMQQLSEVMFTPLSSLRKEQKIALNVLLQYYTQFKELYREALSRNDPLLPTNFVAFSYNPFERLHLPRESHWHWNQSNSKATVQLNNNITVEMIKVNPRKKGCQPAPSFKLWIYDIKQGDNFYHFLWCEKGVPPIGNCNTTKVFVEVGVITSIGIVFPERLNISDFAFLSDFVDESTALDLGWTTAQ